jgi:hypothetical protein
MAKLAGGAGSAKNKPAAFDDATADAGVHVQVQNRPGAHRRTATRLGDSGKGGVVAGQNGPAVSFARPEHAEVDVLPAEVRRLGEVIVNHCPGNRDGDCPDAATVTAADTP